MSATGTQGTSIAVLAPYLPYGIECQVTTGSYKGATAKLGGLCPDMSFPVRLYDGSGMPAPTLSLRFEDVLPMLRSFAALCEPLEDGTVPLYEYVRFMWPNERTMRHNAYGDFIEVHGSTALYLMKRTDFESGSLHRLGSIYLQRLHFAVGLESHQYIRKTN